MTTRGNTLKEQVFELLKSIQPRSLKTKEIAALMKRDRTGVACSCTALEKTGRLKHIGQEYAYNLECEKATKALPDSRARSPRNMAAAGRAAEDDVPSF
jgi:hypothetical protein